MPLDLGNDTGPPSAGPRPAAPQTIEATGLICHRDKKPCTEGRCPLWDEDAESCLDRAVAVQMIDAAAALESAAEHVPQQLGAVLELAPVLLGQVGGARPRPAEVDEADAAEDSDDS